jgi:hypothetical protein
MWGEMWYDCYIILNSAEAPSSSVLLIAFVRSYLKFVQTEQKCCLSLDPHWWMYFESRIWMLCASLALGMMHILYRFRSITCLLGDFKSDYRIESVCEKFSKNSRAAVTLLPVQGPCPPGRPPARVQYFILSKAMSKANRVSGILLLYRER